MIRGERASDPLVHTLSGTSYITAYPVHHGTFTSTLRRQSGQFSGRSASLLLLTILYFTVRYCTVNCCAVWRTETPAADGVQLGSPRSVIIVCSVFEAAIRMQGHGLNHFVSAAPRSSTDFSANIDALPQTTREEDSSVRSRAPHSIAAFSSRGVEKNGSSANHVKPSRHGFLHLPTCSVDGIVGLGGRVGVSPSNSFHQGSSPRAFSRDGNGASSGNSKDDEEVELGEVVPLPVRPPEGSSYNPLDLDDDDNARGGSAVGLYSTGSYDVKPASWSFFVPNGAQISTASTGYPATSPGVVPPRQTGSFSVGAGADSLVAGVRCATSCGDTENGDGTGSPPTGGYVAERPKGNSSQSLQAINGRGSAVRAARAEARDPRRTLSQGQGRKARWGDKVQEGGDSGRGGRKARWGNKPPEQGGLRGEFVALGRTGDEPSPTGTRALPSSGQSGAKGEVVEIHWHSVGGGVSWPGRTRERQHGGGPHIGWQGGESGATSRDWREEYHWRQERGTGAEEGQSSRNRDPERSNGTSGNFHRRDDASKGDSVSSRSSSDTYKNSRKTSGTGGSGPSSSGRADLETTREQDSRQSPAAERMQRGRNAEREDIAADRERSRSPSVGQDRGPPSAPAPAPAPAPASAPVPTTSPPPHRREPSSLQTAIESAAIMSRAPSPPAQREPPSALRSTYSSAITLPMRPRQQPPPYSAVPPPLDGTSLTPPYSAVPPPLEGTSLLPLLPLPPQPPLFRPEVDLPQQAVAPQAPVSLPVVPPAAANVTQTVSAAMVSVGVSMDSISISSMSSNGSAVIPAVALRKPAAAMGEGGGVKRTERNSAGSELAESSSVRGKKRVRVSEAEPSAQPAPVFSSDDEEEIRLGESTAGTRSQRSRGEWPHQFRFLEDARGRLCAVCRKSMVRICTACEKCDECFRGGDRECVPGAEVERRLSPPPQGSAAAPPPWREWPEYPKTVTRFVMLF